MELEIRFVCIQCLDKHRELVSTKGYYQTEYRWDSLTKATQHCKETLFQHEVIAETEFSI